MTRIGRMCADWVATQGTVRQSTDQENERIGRGGVANPFILLIRALYWALQRMQGNNGFDLPVTRQFSICGGAKSVPSLNPL